MKYSAIICLLFLMACVSDRKKVMAKLLDEQKLLKDSANNVSERVGDYTSKGVYDSAKLQKAQLGVIYNRLKDIQASIDSLSRMK